MRRTEVTTRILEHLPELQSRFGVARLLLFGSVARDDAGSDSDVDLLVEFEAPIGLFGLMELQDRLEEILGCSVDLGTPDSLKPTIRDRVLREAVNVA